MPIISIRQPYKMTFNKKIKLRKNYKFFREISTRWNDNDIYGHINNATYYQFFDTAINSVLLDFNLLDLQKGKTIFISAETGCIYFEEIVFPDKITAGIKIKHLGNSSVQYEIGLFKNNNETTSAIGHFVHVLVDKKNRRPIKLPEKFMKALAKLK